MRVMMAGLPGTGKSTLARALAAELEAAVLDKDPIRAALFSGRFLEYSVDQDDFVLDRMIDTADWLERRRPGLTVIFDGRTFSRRYQRDRVQADRIIECVCSDEVARRRLESDTAHPARNRGFALYLEVKSRFEPIDSPKLVVDTDAPLAHLLRRCLPYLRPA